MATDESTAQTNRRLLPRGLAYVFRLIGYGMLATVGTVAVADGLRKLFEFWQPGIDEPGSYLVGVAVLLTVGFTLLLAALAGTVSQAVERGT